MPECSIDSCNRKMNAKGLCLMHYKRMRRYGDPLMVRRVYNIGSECRLNSCHEASIQNGYCRKHYNNWRREGDPEISLLKRYRNETCLVSDCENPTDKAKGLCSKHYTRLKRHSNVHTMLHARYNGESCEIAECESKAYSKKLCQLHYNRISLTGEVGPLHARHAPPGDGYEDSYKRIKVDGKWVKEHRYIMEQSIGRKLNDEEVVHHKDRDKYNNSIANLQLMDNNSKHIALHWKEGW